MPPGWTLDNEIPVEPRDINEIILLASHESVERRRVDYRRVLRYRPSHSCYRKRIWFSLVTHRLARANTAVDKGGYGNQVLIDRPPSGKLQASDYRLKDSAMPEIRDDEVLIKTQAFAITAGTRAGLQGSKRAHPRPVAS